MKHWLATALLFTTFSCIAHNIPSAVKNAFAKNFPGTSVKNWDKENGKYEANFTRDGKMMSATFTTDGILEEIETDIKVSQLPSLVVLYIKSNCKGAIAKEAAMIVRDGAKMYEAEVKGKDLLFDMQGKFLKEEED